MKWTKRKDGTTRTTLNMKVHVPLELAEWLEEHGQLSRTEALDWVRQNVARLASDDFGNTFIYSHELGSVLVGRWDDGIPSDDGYKFYEGPDVLLLPTVRYIS